MPLAIVYFLEFTAILILLGWALYLPYRSGQLYLAPIYCMATGAYFAAYAARDLHWPFGLAIVGALVIGAFFAFLPALGLKRAPGFTVAIVSIALIFIMQTVIMNLAFLGGETGFFGIPSVEHLLPVTYALLVIVGIFVHRIDNSRVGRAAEAVLYDPDVAAALGVNISRINILLQVIAGAMGGLAGAIYAFAIGSIFPAAFGLSLLLYVFATVFVGGPLTMWGVVVFAPILWGLPLIIPTAMAEWRDIMYGALLILIIILRPEGVITKAMVRRFSISSKMWLSRLIGHSRFERG